MGQFKQLERENIRLIRQGEQQRATILQLMRERHVLVFEPESELAEKIRAFVRELSEKEKLKQETPSPETVSDGA